MLCYLGQKYKSSKQRCTSKELFFPKKSFIKKKSGTVSKSKIGKTYQKTKLVETLTMQYKTFFLNVVIGIGEIIQNTDFFQNTSFSESNNIMVEKNLPVTINCHEK